MTETAAIPKGAPPAYDPALYQPTQLVVLRPRRVRYIDETEPKDGYRRFKHVRKRLAVGHVVTVPAFLATLLCDGDDPWARPALPEESAPEHPVAKAGYPDRPGSKGQPTSAKAAEEIAGVAIPLRDRVLETIKGRGDFGATAEELAALLRKPRGTVQPRTSELEALGKIKASGKTRRNLSSGKSATVWVAVDDPAPTKIAGVTPRAKLVDLLLRARPLIPGDTEEGKAIRKEIGQALFANQGA
jgi:hypothetical protein